MHHPLKTIASWCVRLNIVDGLQPIDAVTEQLAAALAALPSHQIRSDIR
jgi:adenylate kinase